VVVAVRVVVVVELSLRKRMKCVQCDWTARGASGGGFIARFQQGMASQLVGKSVPKIQEKRGESDGRVKSNPNSQ
jgi:hypothetical protein